MLDDSPKPIQMHALKINTSLKLDDYALDNFKRDQNIIRIGRTGRQLNPGGPGPLASSLLGEDSKLDSWLEGNLNWAKKSRQELWITHRTRGNKN